MKYKDVLNTGLKKEAAPRWVKQILSLSSRGQNQTANRILSRLLGISTASYQKIQPGTVWNATLQKNVPRWIPLPVSKLVEDKNQAIVNRFVNWRPADRLQRIKRLWAVDNIYNKLNSRQMEDPRVLRYADWLREQANRLGLQLDGENNVVLKPSLEQFLNSTADSNSFRFKQFLSLIQKSPLLKHTKPNLWRFYPSFTNRRIRGPHKNIFINKEISVPLNNQRDFIYGAKDLHNFKQNFEKGNPIFFSGLREVAQRYAQGISHGGGTNIIALPRQRLNNLLFTPHLMEIDDAKRINLLKDVLEGIKSRIHNPGLDINNNMQYETLLRLAQNPRALQHTLLLKKLKDGTLIGHPIDWQHAFQGTKLWSLIQKGILEDPTGKLKAR